jgi:hypothetical protein
MDYSRVQHAHSKCIFYYDFISIFFKGTQYVIHDNEKKYGLKRITTKKFTNLNNYEVLNDQIWTLFQKSLSWSFFVGLTFSPP